jgi:hypothetical protein
VLKTKWGPDGACIFLLIKTIPTGLNTTDVCTRRDNAIDAIDDNSLSKVKKNKDELTTKTT